MALIDDWFEYVEQPSRFDEHHFESFMLELDTADKLHHAFNSVPNGVDFAERLTHFRERAAFNGTYLLPHPQEATSEARHLAENYRDCISDRLRELGDEEATLIGASPVEEIGFAEYRTSRDMRELNLLNAPITIEDDYADFASKYPEWIWGLREAVYMMTTIPEVTRYLLAPIVRYPLDDTSAAELWLMGHRVDFCKTRTLLIVGGAG